MALTKAKKAEKVAELAKELEGSTSAIIGTFAKLTVAQDYALRGVVRNAGGKYRVLKNKLAARASQGTKVEAALQGLKGVSSVAYTSGDPVSLAKALTAWVKEIFAKLLFLINSPAQRLATVLNATGRDLAVVLNQGVEKEKFTGKASAAPADKAEAPATVQPVAPAASVVAAVVEAPAPVETAAEAVAPVVTEPIAETAPAVEVPTPAVEASALVETAAEAVIPATAEPIAEVSPAVVEASAPVEAAPVEAEVPVTETVAEVPAETAAVAEEPAS
jgi:large subunit ribosomal protein L10